MAQDTILYIRLIQMRISNRNFSLDYVKLELAKEYAPTTSACLAMERNAGPLRFDVLYKTSLVAALNKLTTGL